MTKTDQIAYSDQLIRAIFDSLSAHIAIINETGMVLETNQAWKQFSKDNGGSGDETNFNYLHICESASGDGSEDAKQVASGIRDVIEGKRDQFLYDYPCHSPSGKRWFYMRAVLMARTGPVRVIISHEDITQLKLAQEELKAHRDSLEDNNQSLEEANIALKVLIRQREEDKVAMEQKFLGNIKTNVLPYLDKLKLADLNKKNATLVGILDDHLKDIMSPMMQNLSNANILLTPQEMQVASFVKDGKTTSEIADILFVSEATINFHRKNLRKKLGLNKKRVNLRSFLLSMS